MKRLSDRTAVITGSSRGLGLQIARAFLQEGASVVLAARSEKALEAAVISLNGGGQASGKVCDITNPEQAQALGRYAVERYGRLDIWVNNAGISCPMGPTMHIPPKYIVDQIHTNILGVYYGSRVAMGKFLQQGGGKLINLGGRGMKSPTPMFNPYSATKAWTRIFTLALAKEYQKSGTGVYLFNPGLVQTDMMEHMQFIRGYEGPLLKMFGIISRLFSNPPEVPAAKLVWLASSATDGKTGLEVDLLGPRAWLEAARRLASGYRTPVEVGYSLVEPFRIDPTEKEDPLQRSGVGEI